MREYREYPLSTFQPIIAHLHPQYPLALCLIYYVLAAFVSETRRCICACRLNYSILSMLVYVHAFAFISFDLRSVVPKIRHS